MVVGYLIYYVMVIRLDGCGDVIDIYVIWYVINVRCYVLLFVVVDWFLLVVDDCGMVNCFDIYFGKWYWQDCFGCYFSVLLVIVGGLVYFLVDDGVMKVVELVELVKVVVMNCLDEMCSVFLVIVYGQLFICGEKNLYCIVNQYECVVEVIGDQVMLYFRFGYFCGLSELC